MWMSLASYVRIHTSRRCISGSAVRARSRTRSLNRIICGTVRKNLSNPCVSNSPCSSIQGRNALDTLTCVIFRLRSLRISLSFPQSRSFYTWIKARLTGKLKGSPKKNPASLNPSMNYWHSTRRYRSCKLWLIGQSWRIRRAMVISCLTCTRT